MKGFDLFADDEDVGGKQIDGPESFERSIQMRNPFHKAVRKRKVKDSSLWAGKRRKDLVISRVERQKSVVHEHVTGFRQRIAPEVVRVVEYPVEKLGVRISIGKHGHDEISTATNDPVQLLQRFGVDRDVFQNAASDHDIKEIVVIGQAIGVRKLRVFQRGKIVKGAVLGRIDVAAVQFHLCSAEHPDKTGVRGMTAPPVQDGTRIFDDMLAAFENTHLTTNDGEVSGVSMKIRIIAELSLTHIEPVQLSFIVGHWAHGLRVHPSLADPRDSKKVFSRSVLFPSPFGGTCGRYRIGKRQTRSPKARRDGCSFDFVARKEAFSLWDLVISL